MQSAASGPSHFMPPQGTELAGSVDALYEFLLIISFISCVLVIGGLIYFAVKYRRKSDNDKTPYFSHNTALEFLWSFIPFVLFMIVFVWGWIVFHKIRHMPENALEVTVNAQKWDWSFVYKNGRRSAGELVVPMGQDVKLILSSRDVLHSFYVPAFRVKQDVVPGRYYSLWFNANREGTFQVFCAEYCGDRHSGMMAKVKVLPREKYEEWLQTEPYKGLAPAEIGGKVYQARCKQCHNLTSERLVGPGFLGVFGKTEHLEGGGTVLVDENYIRESLMNPNAKLVAGFPGGGMTPFAGQLSEEEIMGVIEFLKTVK
jgi:cytochrome c oxidase subunit 2